MKLTGIDSLTTWKKRLGQHTPFRAYWQHPEIYSACIDFMSGWKIRERHIATRGFPIVTQETLTTLVPCLSGHTVLDCGAGAGYLVHHHRQKGIDIDGIILQQNDYPFKRTFMKKRLIKGDYLTHDLTPYSAFIVSWPDYGHPAAHALLHRLPKGSLLIYQGEDEGGRCANDDFFAYLDAAFTPLDDVSLTLNHTHIQFEGIHDRWSVFVKHLG